MPEKLFYCFSEFVYESMGRSSMAQSNNVSLEFIVFYSTALNSYYRDSSKFRIVFLIFEI